MKIERIKDKEKCLKKAGETLDEIFASYSKYPVLFLSSGGSAFEILNYVNVKNLPKNFTISVLDERFTLNMSDTNFESLAETDFYQSAIAKGARSFDTRAEEGDSKEYLCSKIENMIVSWREDYPEGKIVATFGMGEDCHTAGIFPYPEDELFFKITFVDTMKYLVAYEAKGKNPFEERITSTMSFIESFDAGVCFVDGGKKKSTIEKLVKSEESLHVNPSQIFKKIKNLTLFTTIEE